MTETPESIPAAGEQILAVVGNLTRVSGFMSTRQKAYSLVLTNGRIIFAELTRDMIRETGSQARDAAKAEGKGLIGRLSAQMRAPGGYHERYWEMSPEAILAETPGNFSVARSDIQKIKWRVGMVDESRNTADQLTIKTTSEKLKFQVGGSLSSAKEAFRSAGYAA